MTKTRLRHIGLWRGEGRRKNDKIREKILIHLFLENNEPEQEEFQIPIFTVKEISKMIKEPKKTTNIALKQLDSSGYISFVSESKYCGCFINEMGTGEAKSLILSFAETLQ